MNAAAAPPRTRPMFYDLKAVPADLPGWYSIGSNTVGPYYVSTAFLGMNSARDGAPPETFETMTFKEGVGIGARRYSTFADAVDGHREAVQDVERLARAVPIWRRMWTWATASLV